MRWEAATIRRLPAERHLIAVNYWRRALHSGFCLGVGAQPDDGDDQEANHHDDDDEHPDDRPEQSREIGRLHAWVEQQKHGK
jgi:hypothetical protein